MRASEERLAVLAETCRELNQKFVGARAERVVGEAPPTATIRLASGRVFASFGVIDATWFWTFDGGVSFHYAKDKDVMRRLLGFELGRALLKEPAA